MNTTFRSWLECYCYSVDEPERYAVAIACTWGRRALKVAYPDFFRILNLALNLTWSKSFTASRCSIPHSLLPWRPSRLFALIIGIGNYSSLPKLAGAVNDGKAVEEFLKLDMKVPADRIRHLHDHEASRNDIMKAFKELWGKEKSKRMTRY